MTERKRTSLNRSQISDVVILNRVCLVYFLNTVDFILVKFPLIIRARSAKSVLFIVKFKNTSHNKFPLENGCGTKAYYPTIGSKSCASSATASALHSVHPIHHSLCLDKRLNFGEQMNPVR